MNLSAALLLAVVALAGCGGGDVRTVRPAASAPVAPSASASPPEDASLAAVAGKTVALPRRGAERDRGHSVSESLRVTERAAAKITEMAEDAPEDRRVHVRVYRRCAVDVVFDPEMPADRHAAADGVRIDGDALSLAFLSGAEIDYVDGPHGAGFRFERPRDAPTCETAGWAEALDGLDDRVAACIGTCRDEACRTKCWCVRAVEANHVACASAPSADAVACAGVLTTESALCAVEADMTPLEVR